MSSEAQVYVSVTIVIMFICFFVLNLVKEEKKWPPSSLSKLFICYLIHSVALLVSCAVDLSRSSVMLEYISCIIYPITGYLALYYYGKYYIETCEAPGIGLKHLRRFNILILILNFAINMPLIPSGLFFYVTPDCIYIRGPLFFLSYVFVSVELAVLSIYALVAIPNRLKAVGYVCFGACPLIVSILMSFIQLASPMLDFATVISCLITFSFVSMQDREKALENEAKLTKYKSDIMLSQIGPHFIYNTLSTISALCTADPQKAQNLSADFTDYLRNNLNLAKSQKLSSFEEELNHTRKYLEIEKVRFGDKLRIKYDISEKSFLLPSLSLQPIVENAVKHGVMRRREGGTVIIRTRKRGEDFVVLVSDDGVGFDSDKLEPQEGHYGIVNTAERLRIMLNGELKIESEEGVGTTVTMLIRNPEEGI